MTKIILILILKIFKYISPRSSANCHTAENRSQLQKGISQTVIHTKYFKLLDEALQRRSTDMKNKRL